MKFLAIGQSQALSQIMIVATVFLLSVPFMSDEVFANHFSNDMKWQMVYISSNSVCSNYDYQMLRVYSEVTTKYLEQYELPNTHYEPLCVTNGKYSGYIPPFDLDLLILVYDKDLGRYELQSRQIGGVYHHVGNDNVQNHAIIICDCPTFNFSSPVWILTHELSHFVLTYLGYDLSKIEELVHMNDDAYDECIQSRSFECGNIALKLRLETSAYSYSVMPLYEPAIGGASPESVDEDVPVQVVELAKIFTKWWTQDKISDGEFFNALGFMSSGNSLYRHMNPEILSADSAFDTDVKMEKFLSAEYRNSDQDILSPIPEQLLSNEHLIFDEGKKLGMPTWFKTTAGWWAEGKISDEEFKKQVNFMRNEGLLRPR